MRWAAHLPHSSGKVGTYGPSYLGINQLLVAGSIGKNSPLKAIFPAVAANDVYRDTSFMGGILDAEFDIAYLGLTGRLNMVNPLVDAAQSPPTDAATAEYLAAVEADHANGLATYHAEQDIEIFPTFATIARGHSLRITLSTSAAPHLLHTAAQLQKLAGGLYTVHRGGAAPSALEVPLQRTR